MNCWQCGAASDGLFCPACDALQPPAVDQDHFNRLGLERRFALDPEVVTSKHRALARKLHPDRFATRGPRERRFSLEHTTALNDALRTLKDPLRRAEYLLTLRGRPVDEEGAGRVQLEPAFLMEVIELREAIAELTGQDAHVERGRLALEVVARYEDQLARLGAGLDGEAADEALVQDAAQLRYLRKILDEVAALDA